MAKSSERRDGPRIDLRLRVRYSTGDITGEAEASDVSPKGLRLEGGSPVPDGVELKMVLDSGDEEEEINATGRVTWCRGRESPTGKQMYDIGVHFATDWLAQERGPLGSALARIFAMNRYEPARNYERTRVSLQAATSSSPPVKLEVADISVGGTQLRAPGGLDEGVKRGCIVIVELEGDGKSHSIDGKVVWVARAADTEGADIDSFGVQFAELAEAETEYLENVRRGEEAPERISVFLQS